MDWWKFLWFRFRYMKLFEKTKKALSKHYGITKTTKDEEQIILFHASVGGGVHEIASIINRGRLRKQILAKLQDMGIGEDSLTDDEMQFIEELLGKGYSIDEIVSEVRRFRDRQATPNTNKHDT
ncbi:hypothetical protein [Pandoraea communis]|uniref:hypothetical protein n=1 Tax=Pandoraea communis TaxID=2508297 RepID=UPI0025A614AC|nr:hypothetical protein [Pandoraea communis]MDM8356181.1 hypothetical protein [Pandoraea communis]